MSNVDVFSVRDLRQRSGDLLRDAEAGSLSVITKHGRPAILAIPFDHHLLEHGVHRVLALHLFRTGQFTMAQAARMAGVSLDEFLDLLKVIGVDAVDYPPEQLDEELNAALP